MLPERRGKRGKKDKIAKVINAKLIRKWIKFVLGVLEPLFTVGIQVYDTFLGRRRTVKLLLASDVEDGHGLATTMGCRGNGAAIGACPYCQQKGYRFKMGDGSSNKGGTQYYPGAVCFNDRLEQRVQWEAAFQGAENIRHLSTQPRPKKSTLQDALRDVADIARYIIPIEKTYRTECICTLYRLYVGMVQRRIGSSTTSMTQVSFMKHFPNSTTWRQP